VEFNFNDPNWKPFTPAKLSNTANQLYFNATTSAGALVVRQSKDHTELSLSKDARDYLYDAVQAGRIKTGVVVFVKRDRTITERSIAEVVASLEGIPPRDDGRGPYWWLDPDGMPQRPMRDDEVPF
jgi:hypothetical protein